MRIGLIAVLSLVAIPSGRAADNPSLSRTISTSQPAGWRQIPGYARDVGAGPGNSIYVIGGAAVPGGYEIFAWTGSDWRKMVGGALRVAVDNTRTPWVVNSSGSVFVLMGVNGWHELDQPGIDVGSGGGETWIVGTGMAPGGGGHTIWRYTDRGFTLVPGGAERITVDNAGRAWVINDAGNIYLWNVDSWRQMPGIARDIAAGADGSVWCIGGAQIGNGGNYEIFRWDGNTWVKTDGGGVSIAVDGFGHPIVTASDMTIWIRDN